MTVRKNTAKKSRRIVIKRNAQFEVIIKWTGTFGEWISGQQEMMEILEQFGNPEVVEISTVQEEK